MMGAAVLFFKEAETISFSKAAPVLLFFKGFIGPYMRGGKMVNLKGYHSARTKTVRSTTGQSALFGDLAPPPEVKQTAKVARALTTWMQRHGGPAGMSRLLADMSPEHQEKLVDAMAKIGKTDADTVRGMLASGAQAQVGAAGGDLFGQPDGNASADAPAGSQKNNLAAGLPYTEGEVLARKEVAMMVNKRQEMSQFSKYATGRYILTLQSGEGWKSIVAYSVSERNGFVFTQQIPTEMLENGAFSKLNDEAIKLFNAPTSGLFDSGGQDTITMPRAEAVKEHERLVDVLNSPSHKDDKAEAKRQALELKDYKGDAKPSPDKKLLLLQPGTSEKLNQTSSNLINNSPASTQESNMDSSQKYEQMLRDGASNDEITAAMKLDGLSAPHERAKVWEKISPKKPVAEKPKAPARVDPAEKFRSAARALSGVELGRNEAKFVKDIADSKYALSAAQKQWLKKIADKHGVNLEYKAREKAPSVKRNVVYGNPDNPPKHMDIPVWDADGGYWYDAEW